MSALRSVRIVVSPTLSHTVPYFQRIKAPSCLKVEVVDHCIVQERDRTLPRLDTGG